MQVIKLIEGGLQLSEYQARKAFSVYLNCILQRLSDFDDASGDIGQVRSTKNLLVKFDDIVEHHKNNVIFETFCNVNGTGAVIRFHPAYSISLVRLFHYQPALIK